MTRAFLLLSLSIPAAGCVLGHAELVRRDMQGGVLALKGDRDEAMRDAERQMSAHCQGPFTVVGEENAVVGTHTEAADQTAPLHQR